MGGGCCAGRWQAGLSGEQERACPVPRMPSKVQDVPLIARSHHRTHVGYKRMRGPKPGVAGRSAAATRLNRWPHREMPDRRCLGAAGLAASTRHVRGRVDGLLIASNQMKVAPALAGVNPIHAGDRLLAAPVAAFVALAALLGFRCGAPYIETGACQQDVNVNAQARHDHPPRFGAVTSRMTMVLCPR